MNIHQLWQSVLGELELTLSKANFTTWFKGTYIIELSGNRIIIGVPNTFTKAWLEKKFRKTIIEILERYTAQSLREMEFRVSQKKNTPQNRDATTTTITNDGSAQANTPPQINAIGFTNDIEAIDNSTKDAFQNSTSSMQPAFANSSVNAFKLNAKYAFSSFIVGKCNELAHAAAHAVAENPGHSYNPLFIYGGVGLGKTHLLQSIGNKILFDKPKAKILYVSCEKFTSDFVSAIAQKKIDKFKITYRSVDLLLMDDVQFLAGKEMTQEEFFHTFNELHQNNKQLVVTSDRPPKSIPELESRLLSRFEWGMIADVAPIDFETRLAIIESKCLDKGLKLDRESIDYIARAINNNVREIEGAINRIKAHVDLQNMQTNLSSIKNILVTISTAPRSDSLSSIEILKAVSLFFDIAIEDLLSKSRERRLAYPRQIAMFLLREELRSSYPAIGQELGGRDHTTVMHACQKIAKDIDVNEKVKQDFTMIKQKLST